MRKAVQAKEPRRGRAQGGDVQPGVPPHPAGGDAAAQAVDAQAARPVVTAVVLLRTADGRWDYRVVDRQNNVVLRNDGLPEVWAALEEIAAYWPGD